MVVSVVGGPNDGTVFEARRELPLDGDRVYSVLSRDSEVVHVYAYSLAAGRWDYVGVESRRECLGRARFSGKSK